MGGIVSSNTENWIDIEILDDVQDGMVEDATHFDEDEMDEDPNFEHGTVEDDADDDGNIVERAPLPTRRKDS